MLCSPFQQLSSFSHWKTISNVIFLKVFFFLSDSLLFKKKSQNNPVQPLWSKQFWAFVSFMLETQLNQMLFPLGDSTASSGYTVLLCSSCRSRVMLPSCSCKSVEGQSFVLCCFTKVTITVFCYLPFHWDGRNHLLSWTGGIHFKLIQTTRGT